MLQRSSPSTCTLRLRGPSLCGARAISPLSTRRCATRATAPSAPSCGASRTASAAPPSGRRRRRHAAQHWHPSGRLSCMAPHSALLTATPTLTPCRVPTLRAMFSQHAGHAWCAMARRHHQRLASTTAGRACWSLVRRVSQRPSLRSRHQPPGRTRQRLGRRPSRRSRRHKRLQCQMPPFLLPASWGSHRPRAQRYAAKTTRCPHWPSPY